MFPELNIKMVHALTVFLLATLAPIGLSFSIYTSSDRGDNTETSNLNRPSAFDETSKCVKLYCLNKNMEDFQACYGRCLRFIVEEPTVAADLFLTPPKRQVDPLQSCIEAKCAGMHKGHYGNCIYRRCITGVYKTAKKRLALNDPESHYPKLPTTYADRVRNNLLGEATFENDITQLIKEHEIKLSDLLLSHLSAESHQGSDRPSSLNLYDIMPKNSPKKRSWNDIVQNCIKYNCSNHKPGSARYNVCMQVYCSKALGRRESRESSTEDNDVK